MTMSLVTGVRSPEEKTHARQGALLQSPASGLQPEFQPLDIAACYGTGFTANAIRWGTASLLAPPRLRIGPSHVAVLCEFHGRMVWVESTTLCPHPCIILARHINGCQAHLPEIRIQDYVASGGHVDLYRVAPIEKLSSDEGDLLKMPAVWNI